MKLSHPLEQLRREYQNAQLDLSLMADPFGQLKIWLEQAISAQLPDPSAMVLATANKQAQPSIRVVLLKGIENKQLIFFSHYESHKGQDLAENPFVAVDFFWPLLERQIIVQGQVSPIAKEASDRYFHQRPRESQLSAWASKQSQVIDSREYLLEKQQQVTLEFQDKDIPRPRYWGGYAIKPHYFEFWQGRESRLHDRIAYLYREDAWDMKRLAP